MGQAARRDAASGRRGASGAGEDRALAGLELAWADSGYHGFSADGGMWSAITSAGDVLTGSTADGLDRAIRAHWQALQ